MSIFNDSPVVRSTEAPVGMQTVFADRTDSYSAFYVPNVEYANIDGQPLTLQLLLPRAIPAPESCKNPLIVFVQGSAWRKQNTYTNIPQLCDFAHQGYVVAVVEYRASDDAPFPAQVQDTKTAIRFLKAHAKQYGIDPDRVAVWGDSSGGHTALMVGYTDGLSDFDIGSNLDQSSSVRAVVDFYGPTDISKMFDFPRAKWAAELQENEVPENILFRGSVKNNPEIAQPGNPLNFVTTEKKLPPTLIMHGDEDELVPFNQSVILYEKLKKCAQSVIFYKVQGAMHGYRMWTKPVLKIVGDFLKAHI